MIPAIGFFLLAMAQGFSQSEALTSSPYSLYGLGIINQTSIGKSNGLGYTGIGLKTTTEINNLNPANYALIPQNSFFYDVGISGEINTYSNKSYTEDKSNVNFSNLAFAFRIDEGLGAGISLVPYSNVGYSLIGIQSNIEGSTETFESSITGIGALTDLKLNLGYAVVDQLRLGLSGSLLFGNIEENETLVLRSSAFQLNEKTNYSGFRLGLGMQFDLTDRITLGSTLQLPTSLKASLERSVTKSLDGTEITVEDNNADTAANFKMPMELGLGFSSKWFSSFTLSADYKKNYWSATHQTDNAGKYINQDIFGVGLEFIKDTQSFNFFDRINYRLGYTYDNGYLEVNDKKIDGFTMTAGLGLPISLQTNSMINLSYSYGSKGHIENILIKENYHLITLNMSLEDIWFRKRKIN